MTIPTTYPGVYIEEIAPGAPIEGVGTSTAAFLGPCATGPLNQPTKVTSWDQFKRVFGGSPLDGFYLWYAVRGFYDNGGRVCYVTRVSNARHAELVLMDRTATPGTPTIRLWARQPGNLSPAITVTVADAHAVSGATHYRPTAEVAVASTGTVITTTRAAQAATFRPTDVVTIEGTTTTASVIRVEDASVVLSRDLVANAGQTLRLANLTLGVTTTLRLEGAAHLCSGSVIELTQDARSEFAVVKSVQIERLSAALTTYRVELMSAVAHAYDLASSAAAIDVQSHEFTLTVTQGSPPRPRRYARYADLGMHPEHRNYYRRVINEDPSGLIYADPVEPPNTATPPNNRPREITSETALAGGADESRAILASSDYSAALAQLEAIDDINLVAIPDRTDLDVQLNLINHCKLQAKDRFAILDSRRGAGLFGTDSVELQFGALEEDKGFGALYYPWLLVSPASGTSPVLVPPSGHVAGILARIDNTRGVHKAPAGTDALVSAALGVERTMSDIEQGQLNILGINVIRVFSSPGSPIVWGARTTATGMNKTWQYVNIRRLMLFLEESIEEGIRWAVFEPNNLSLWKKLERTIGSFLNRVWRDGALFGETAEKAYFVRIDEALNPPSDRKLGRLNIEIGVQPTYPAEFIIVRIGLWDGGADVTEA